MLIGSEKCGPCVCLGHLKAIGKIFPFLETCATSQYKQMWLAWPETTPDPSASVLYSADALKKLQGPCLAIHHSWAAEMPSCKRCELTGFDLTLTNYRSLSLSAWPWLRPWESLVSKEPHPDYDILYNIKLSSLTLPNPHLDFWHKCVLFRATCTFTCFEAFYYL